MRIVEYYSHMNGLEYILVHKPKLWDEIKAVIEGVDAAIHRVKVSREKTMVGKLLYSPTSTSGTPHSNWPTTFHTASA